MVCPIAQGGHKDCAGVFTTTHNVSVNVVASAPTLIVLKQPVWNGVVHITVNMTDCKNTTGCQLVKAT